MGHTKRHSFQKSLFDVLAPILGSPDVREAAAKGIYGGQLPFWWRDLESESLENTQSCEAAVAEQNVFTITPEWLSFLSPQQLDDFKNDLTFLANKFSLSEAVIECITLRPRCRYGSDCRRKNPEHRQEFAHPGDPDWDAVVLGETIKLAKDNTALAQKQCRPCCRYGEKCY